MEHGNQQSLIKQTQGSPELLTQASLPSQFQGVEPSPQHKVLFEPCRESSKCCSHIVPGHYSTGFTFATNKAVAFFRNSSLLIVVLSFLSCSARSMAKAKQSGPNLEPASR